LPSPTDLVNRYDVSGSKMTTDMFLLSYSHQVLSSFMTYNGVCNKSNTTGATRGAGTTHSGAPEFTPRF